MPSKSPKSEIITDDEKSKIVQRLVIYLAILGVIAWITIDKCLNYAHC